MDSGHSGKLESNDGGYSSVKAMHDEAHEGGGKSRPCLEVEGLRVFGLGNFCLIKGYWLS